MLLNARLPIIALIVKCGETKLKPKAHWIDKCSINTLDDLVKDICSEFDKKIIMNQDI